nr:YitT family protein [Peptoniphilus sp. KCTC 25270]
MIVIGSIIYTYGVNGFIMPNKFSSGGVSGLAIIIYYLTNIGIGTSNFLLNTTIVILGWRFLEKRTLIFTGITLTIVSFLLNYFTPPPFYSENLLISAAAGGLCTGLGMGIILRGRGTTAGTDIIALMLKKYLGIPFASAVLGCNVIVVFISSFTIGVEKAIVTLIMLFISSKLINAVTEGFDQKKSIMVVSNEPNAIAEEVVHKIDRGITVLYGRGYFSKTEKQVLYIVVSRYQSLKIQRLIAEVDPHAFISVSDVQQVIGQGFTFFNPTNRNDKFYLKY